MSNYQVEAEAPISVTNYGATANVDFSDMYEVTHTLFEPWTSSEGFTYFNSLGFKALDYDTIPLPLTEPVYLRLDLTAVMDVRTVYIHVAFTAFDQTVDLFVTEEEELLTDEDWWQDLCQDEGKLDKYSRKVFMCNQHGRYLHLKSNRALDLIDFKVWHLPSVSLLRTNDDLGEAGYPYLSVTTESDYTSATSDWLKGLLYGSASSATTLNDNDYTVTINGSVGNNCHLRNEYGVTVWLEELLIYCFVDPCPAMLVYMLPSISDIPSDTTKTSLDTISSYLCAASDGAVQ